LSRPSCTVTRRPLARHARGPAWPGSACSAHVRPGLAQLGSGACLRGGAARARDGVARLLGGGDFICVGGGLHTRSGGGFGEEPTARRAHRVEGATVRWQATQRSGGTVPTNGAGRGGNVMWHSPAMRAQRLRTRWQWSMAAGRLLRQPEL
jgi:hypothetical protein